MERRNRSLEALKKLYYIDSLEEYDRAQALEFWMKKYFVQDFESSFDLEIEDLKKLSELFYKNINFLKSHTKELKQQIHNNENIKKFFS